MRLRKLLVTALVALAFIAVPVHAQVQDGADAPLPPAQFQDHGGLSPWFWIGVESIFSAGYNLETGAGGFRNHGGDYYTSASFNVAFVDSHYTSPKFYQVPKDLDPEAWTGRFYFLNFTARLNNYESTPEYNSPAWLAEISGKGMHVGFFTQAGELIGGTSNSGVSGTSEGTRKPIGYITGGNKVLNLRSNQLGLYYYSNAESYDEISATRYTTSTVNSNPGGAIMYLGYEKQELFSTYLTMLSEGNVNSNITGTDANGNEITVNQGFAGVVDFGITPFGLFTDEDNPLTLDISGNFIAGFNFNQAPNSQNGVGFGLKAQPGIWMGRENFVLSPVVAFDGKLDAYNDFYWKAGGGLVFQFSGMRWVSDDWGDLHNTGLQTGGWARPFTDIQYENNKILKYAYAQAYMAYSEQRDLNILFRIEEPDGETGFHDKLGFMLELRLYDLTGSTVNTSGETVKTDTSWETQGRVSWDINVKQYIITPYLRGYLNNDEIVKVRIGAYTNLIPYTAFELAYTSANLNADSKKAPVYSSNSSYRGTSDSFRDLGRIEFIVTLKSDDMRPQSRKRMSDWYYPDSIQHY